MNAVVSNERGPYTDTVQGPLIWLALDGSKPDTRILPQDVVSLASPKHQIGAISTLDRNSQQAKIAGRTYGLSVDLRGH